MNKNRIRLTESQLHSIIKECVTSILNEEIDEGFGNWFQAAADGLSNMGKYSQGPTNSKLTNFAKNVAGQKQYYDDMDSSCQAYQNGIGNSASNQSRQSQMRLHRASQNGRTPTQGEMSQNYENMRNAKDAQRKAASARRARQYGYGR